MNEQQDHDHSSLDDTTERRRWDEEMDRDYAEMESPLGDILGKRVRAWSASQIVIGRLVQANPVRIEQEQTRRPFVFSGTYTLEILEG